MFEYELYRFTKIIYANCPTFIPAKFPDGIAGKIALLTKVLKEEPRLSEICADALKLTEALWRHRDLRNLLIHGSITHIENSSTLIFLVPPQIGDGPLKRAQEEKVELSRIEMAAPTWKMVLLSSGFLWVDSRGPFPFHQDLTPLKYYDDR